MMHHIVSKKNMLLKSFILTLFFVSMNSACSQTFFEKMATETHPDDPKTPKKLRLKKFDDIPEFKKIESESKKQWDDIGDEIEKDMKALFKLERELGKLKKFSIRSALELSQKQAQINIAGYKYRLALNKAKSLFSRKIFKEILKNWGFDKVATENDWIKNDYAGWVKKMRIVRKFNDIPEFKEIDVDDADIKSWNRICDSVRQNAKTLHMSEYDSGFEDAEALFKKILE